jgi:hypothetical protein
LTKALVEVTVQGMHKIYKFTVSGTQKTVSVNGQPLQLKRRSTEPEGYTNPDRLALSILCDCVGCHAALRLAHEFQQDVVNNCEAGKERSSEEIGEWVHFQCRISASAQPVGLTTSGTNGTVHIATPLRFPRLLAVQKH